MAHAQVLLLLLLVILVLSMLGIMLVLVLAVPTVLDQAAYLLLCSLLLVLLLGTVLGVCGIAVTLPLTPFAESLGFVPLHWTFLPFLVVVAVTYLGAVELVKRRFFRAIDAS